MKFYNVECKHIQLYSWREPQTTTLNFTVPFVFTSDGIVYARSLNPSIYSDVWMPGLDLGDRIVFESGAICGFRESSAFLSADKDCLQKLSLGRYIEEDQQIVLDESLKELVFIKKDDGSYNMQMPELSGPVYDVTRGLSSVYIDYTLRPVDFELITPPSGYKVEDYQIIFEPFVYSSSINIPSYAPNQDIQAALPVKVVRTEDSFYIQGLSFLCGDPELWVKGVIQGNNVAFPHGDLIGYNKSGSPIFMNAVSVNHKYQSHEGHVRINIEMKALEEDLTFKYDPSTGNLTQPSASINFLSRPDHSWTYDGNYDDYPYTEVDLYEDIKIVRIPDDYEFYPVPPYIIDRSYLLVSYLDLNGYMMDPFDLYIEVTKDGEPVNVPYLDITDWTQKEGHLIPFYTYYREKVLGAYGGGYSLCNYPRCYFYNLFSTPGLTVNLLYKRNGNIFNSSSVADIPVDSHANEGASVICDLFGRAVNSENLSKGIYISNGKKFIIP